MIYQGYLQCSDCLCYLSRRANIQHEITRKERRRSGKGARDDDVERQRSTDRTRMGMSQEGGRATDDPQGIDYRDPGERFAAKAEEVTVGATTPQHRRTIMKIRIFLIYLRANAASQLGTSGVRKTPGAADAVPATISRSFGEDG